MLCVTFRPEPCKSLRGLQPLVWYNRAAFIRGQHKASARMIFCCFSPKWRCDRFINPPQLAVVRVEPSIATHLAEPAVRPNTQIATGFDDCARFDRCGAVDPRAIKRRPPQCPNPYAKKTFWGLWSAAWAVLNSVAYQRCHRFSSRSALQFRAPDRPRLLKPDQSLPDPA